MCMVLLISYHLRGLGAHGYRSKSDRAGIMSWAYLMPQVVFLPGSSLMVHFGRHVKPGVLQNLISTWLQTLKGCEVFPA